ncbi:Histidine kinase [Ekhidna lutea]|uniref:Histidine kinase n=1 Tax=Ekhidna lutea TaxID=447679 RepID=A0A239H6G6_EKHLU|nr:histidine kinase [Ekhidna lutea]SNS76393.1 Histidine kinase [Ekhidna lutea]
MSNWRQYCRNNWKRHLIGALLIFPFGGAMNMVVFCDNCLQEPFLFSYNFWLSFSYSGLAWILFWKGSELLVDFWDLHIPWVVSPIKRFLASVISIIIFVFIAVWALDLFFDLIVLGKTWTETIKSSGAPYWNTLWITLGINVFMHGRGFLIAWRQAAIDNEKLKTEQISSQFNSLKNQVNPHFLFNAMNALSELVYQDQDKAVEFIRKLSSVYRYVLDSKDEEVIPVQDEMKFVTNFVFLQKIRFGENLKVEIGALEGDFFVPPLAIQILVENAIKHNVVSEKDPLTVKVQFKEDTCSIWNSLKEKKVKDSTGIGLENLKARYKYLTDREVIVTKTSKFFEVKLPLLKVKK